MNARDLLSKKKLDKPINASWPPLGVNFRGKQLHREILLQLNFVYIRVWMLYFWKIDEV